uniref:Putative cysteine synthase Voas-tl5 n=1 Tax=Vicia sativa TaxID=3908 RepID=A1XNB2_VICSA|nr:putative cysteine synthase Voas-tl5 [Vicia sativa]
MYEYAWTPRGLQGTSRCRVTPNRRLMRATGASFAIQLRNELNRAVVDEPCRGILRFSGHWILTNVFVT